MTRRPAWALAAVVALAAGLRFWRLGAGLPDVVQVDGFKFVDTALAMATTGDWSPRLYQYPELYTRLLALLYAAFGISGREGAYLAARAVAATFGTGLVVLTWAAARRVAAPAGALLAAALVAVDPLLLTSSRTAVTECLLACFAVATLWSLARADPAPRHLAWAGLCAGLATGTKFSGAFLAPFVALGALRVGWRRGPRPALLGLAAAGAAGGLAFLATTPWFVARLPRYLGRAGSEYLIQRYGQVGCVQGGWLDYLLSTTPTWSQPWLGTSLVGDLGPLVAGAALLACLLAVSTRFGFPVFLHALYALGFLALLAHPGGVKAGRFLVPILPSLFVLCGWLLDRLPRPRDARARAALAAGLSALLLAAPAARSLRYLDLARRPTSVAEARAWLLQAVDPRAPVFLSPFFVDALAEATRRPLYLPDVGQRHYRFPEQPDFNAELRPIYYPELLDELRAHGARYVVTNSYYDDAFSDVPENRRYFPRSLEAYRAWRERLEREAVEVQRIEGWRAGRLGPDIAIFRLREPPGARSRAW